MEQFLQPAEAAWRYLLTLDAEAWLTIVAVLILLQLVGLGRSARRMSARVAAMEAQLKQITERVSMMLDLMVDAEERLLGIQRRADEARLAAERRAESGDPSGRRL